MTTALVVIDVQKAMFGDPAFKLHDGEGTVARIAGLIARAREHGAPIFFVQHDGGPSSPFRPARRVSRSTTPWRPRRRRRDDQASIGFSVG